MTLLIGTRMDWMGQENGIGRHLPAHEIDVTFVGFIKFMLRCRAKALRWPRLYRYNRQTLATQNMLRHKLPVRAVASLAIPLSWFADASEVHAQALPNWFYQSQTSLVVPYIGGSLNSRNQDGTFSNQPATLKISVAGSPHTVVTLDTGSTGIAISSQIVTPSLLSGAKHIGSGAINYDSSGVTPTGDFYELPVSILGGTNSATGTSATGTTSVKVLVVTNDEPGNPTKYMGIGNNRNNVYSGKFDPNMSFSENVEQQKISQIPATGMNPLIDVAINGMALPNQGYVVMNNQVVIGLTTQNNDYSFIKLLPDPASGPQMWQTIPVTINTGDASTIGDLLPDTGIGYAFIKPYSASDNYTVGVNLPGMSPQQGAFYSFQNVPSSSCDAGTSNAMQPCTVKEGSGSTGFLNSGRQFYSGFNYLFDPVNGYAGFALSDSGLPTTATITPLLSLTGSVTLPSGVGINSPISLFGPTSLTTTQGGTVALNAPVLGFGNSLTLSSGGLFSFSSPVNLVSGAFSLQQGAATIGAGLTARTLTVSSLGTLNNLQGSTIIATGPNQNQGTFINNGVLTGNLSNSGTLSGNGTVKGNLINTGTIAPGNSIGTHTVNGNYAHSAGTIVTEIQGPQNDRINVTGAVTSFTGRANLIAYGGGSPFPGFSYTIVSASSSPAFATSSTLNLDQSQLGSALLRYGTTLIQDPRSNAQTFAVQWRPNNPSGATTAAMQTLGNGSALSVAGALDRAFHVLASVATNNANNSGTTIANTGFSTGQATAAGMSPGFVTALNSLVLLPSANQLVAAVNSLAAQPFAAFQSVALETLKQQRQTTLAQAGQCLSNGWVLNGNKAKRPLCAFAQAQNSSTAVQGNHKLASYNDGIFSSGFGLEYYPSKQWSVGMSYGYGTSYANNFSTAPATITSAVNGINLFGSYRASDRWRLRALLGYSNFNLESSRSLAYLGNGTTLSANPTGNGLTAAVEADYSIPLTRPSATTQAVLKPLLGLAWGSYQQSGFTESGHALGLTLESNTANSFITTAGVELTTSLIPLNRSKSLGIRPTLLVSYQLDALANNSANTSINAFFSQAGGAYGGFSSKGQNLGANSLNLNGGVDVQISQSTAVYLNASYNAYSNASQFGYGGGVRVRF